MDRGSLTKLPREDRPGAKYGGGRPGATPPLEQSSDVLRCAVLRCAVVCCVGVGGWFKFFVQASQRVQVGRHACAM